MMVLVTGGSGFVGRRLCDALLARGHDVTVVGRDPAGARKRWQETAGERARDSIHFRGWLPELDAYDAVINLAGEPVFGKRWNDKVKAEIRSSRIEATTTIVKAIKEAKDPPDVLINASAIGFYGDRGDEVLTETSKPGDDFLAEVCQEWEGAAADCPARTVFIRIGVVMGRGGGALEQMLPPFKMGVGGPIGSGKAWFSWVHIDDVVGLMIRALDGAGPEGAKFDKPVLEGPVNAVAPNAVTNKVYTKALGKVLVRPTLFPVPPIGLKLMFGGAAEVLLSSARCEPAAAKAAGYTFKYPEIEPALRQILDR